MRWGLYWKIRMVRLFGGDPKTVLYTEITSKYYSEPEFRDYFFTAKLFMLKWNEVGGFIRKASHSKLGHEKIEKLELVVKV